MTSADVPTPAVLDEWVARSWDRRPPFSRECLVEMWHEEQASRAAAHEKDWRTKELKELRQRVAALEKTLGPGGRTMVDGLAKAIGTTLRRLRAEDREKLLAEVEKRGYAVFQGVYDEAAAYQKGSLVSHGGGLWIATGSCEPGARPGRGACWRLAVKAGDGSKGVVTA